MKIDLILCLEQNWLLVEDALSGNEESIVFWISSTYYRRSSVVFDRHSGSGVKNASDRIHGFLHRSQQRQIIDMSQMRIDHFNLVARVIASCVFDVLEHVQKVNAFAIQTESQEHVQYEVLNVDHLEQHLQVTLF